MRRRYPPAPPLQLEVVEGVRRQCPVGPLRVGRHLSDPRPAGGFVEPVGAGARVGRQPEEAEPVVPCPVRCCFEECPAEAPAAPVGPHREPLDLAPVPPVLGGCPHHLHRPPPPTPLPRGEPPPRPPPP